VSTQRIGTGLGERLLECGHPFWFPSSLCSVALLRHLRASLKVESHPFAMLEILLVSRSQGVRGREEYRDSISHTSFLQLKTCPLAKGGT
jgi:hypothetical protein